MSDGCEREPERVALWLVVGIVLAAAVYGVVAWFF